MTGFVLASADSVADNVVMDRAAARTTPSIFCVRKPGIRCVSLSELAHVATGWRFRRTFAAGVSLGDRSDRTLIRLGSVATPH